MAIFAHVLGDSPIQIWGLTPTERLHRQFKELKAVAQIDDLSDLPGDAVLLLVRADYVMEMRTLNQLMFRPNVALRCPADRQLAAAFVPARQAPQTLALLNNESVETPANLDIIDPATLGGYDTQLLRTVSQASGTAIKTEPNVTSTIN